MGATTDHRRPDRRRPVQANSRNSNERRSRRHVNSRRSARSRSNALHKWSGNRRRRRVNSRRGGHSNSSNSSGHLKRSASSKNGLDNRRSPRRRTRTRTSHQRGKASFKRFGRSIGRKAGFAPFYSKPCISLVATSLNAFIVTIA